MGETIEYPRADGGNVPAWVTGPAAGPAVIVVQEWWGLNDQIKACAERVAQAGFRALVPDLFRGRVTQDANEAKHLMDGLDWEGAVRGDIRGAVRFLGQDGDKVGIMGFCMGGAVTVLAAANLPAIQAAVCFYGIPPAESCDPANIKAPFQGHFAHEDDWVTPAVVNGLESRLQSGEVDYELFRYDAKHAFMNKARPEVYDPDHAGRAWKRTLRFFGEHLKA
ncbi:MAG: dienelactone hydrolase family protein [Myxococcota bacterium]